MDEIDWLERDFHIRHIGFLDDIFGISSDWALEFCEALSSRPYRLSWMICLHPLSFGRNRRKVFEAMTRAGLSFISFGAQSANPAVLQNINRHPTEIEALREAVPICRSLGIGTSLTYIFGLPGDTPETVQEAVNFTLQTRPTLADFHPLWYFLGSELGDKFPNCDANPYSFTQHKQWSKKARRSFYFNIVTIVRIIYYIARNNPRYFFTLIRIALYGLPHYLFESEDYVKWDSGDERTS